MSNMFGTKFRFSDISRTSVQALKTFSGSSALLDAKARFESWNTRPATNIRNPLRAAWWRSRRTFGEQSLRSTASMRVFLRFWARLVFDNSMIITMMMIENNSTKSGKVFLWSRDNRSDQQKALDWWQWCRDGWCWTSSGLGIPRQTWGDEGNFGDHATIPMSGDQNHKPSDEPLPHFAMFHQGQRIPMTRLTWRHEGW